MTLSKKGLFVGIGVVIAFVVIAGAVAYNPPDEQPISKNTQKIETKAAEAIVGDPVMTEVRLSEKMIEESGIEKAIRDDANAIKAMNPSGKFDELKKMAPDKEPEKCDPSYPDVCISPYPPDLDCDEIEFKNFKVIQPDPHRFDADKDGIGCEK